MRKYNNSYECSMKIENKRLESVIIQHRLEEPLNYLGL